MRAFAIITLGAGIAHCLVAVRADGAVSGRAAPSREKREPAPAHHRDERLNKLVNLPWQSLSTGECVEELARQTGVVLRIEPRFLRRRLAMVLDRRSAREIMDALALLFGAKWEKVADVYVLATDKRLAELTALTEDERTARWRENFGALTKSLTPAQRRRLEAAGRLDLSPEATTPRQRQILGEIGALAYGSEVGPGPPDLSPGWFSLSIISPMGSPELSLWHHSAIAGSHILMSRVLNDSP